MPSTVLWIIALLAVALVFFALGGNYRAKKEAERVGSAQDIANKILADANAEAEQSKKAVLIEAKEEIHQLRDEQNEAYNRRQDELQDMEKRLIRREDSLDEKEKKLNSLDQSLSDRKKSLDQRHQEVDQLYEEQKRELERISALSKEEAKAIILDEAKADSIHERAQILREAEEETRETAEDVAREIVTRTIQRYSSDYVAESTVSVVNLPNDEMKGRIIGREGRNIRAFETISGVDLIIDDTPQAVVLSCFDPVRREVARVALEKLIADGRIHPTRIEELYGKAEEEVKHSIREAGQQAVEEVGIRRINPELVKILGRMKYRTSYGQNALSHSVEVAKFAGLLAQEVGANVQIAKRGGLLHDLGKAVDHEIEAPHVELGVKIARKYKESDAVIECIAAHHNDIEPQSLEALLVQAADAISAARPGARRESMESYVKRLEDLEAIATSFAGVSQAYAIQAGREIRIMLQPDKVSEDEMTLLAHEIAQTIEDKLEYPGQVKVNLIRETRATDYAK